MPVLRRLYDLEAFLSEHLGGLGGVLVGDHEVDVVVGLGTGGVGTAGGESEEREEEGEARAHGGLRWSCLALSGQTAERNPPTSTPTISTTSQSRSGPPSGRWSATNAWAARVVADVAVDAGRMVLVIG